MKKIVLIDSAFPINVRNKKIIDSLDLIGCYSLSIIAWNRENAIIDENKSNIDNYIYKSNAKYGNPFRKAIKLVSFAQYVYNKIRHINPDFIIASHWDVLLICTLLKNKSTKIIYENLDIPTSENKILYILLKKIEKFALKRTNTIILASRFYSELYRGFKGEVYIIENLPFKNILNDKENTFNLDTDKIKLAFIGGLRYFSVMKNLIKACENLDIELLFFGGGHEYDDFISYSKGINNVHFFGPYDYSKINSIYRMVDVVWAVYPSNDPNVRYAISNKFFESLVFEKPAYYAKDTFLGSYVVENNIGLSVDCYNPDAIRSSLIDIISNPNKIATIKESINEYKQNTNLFWEDYLPILKSVFK